MARSSVCACGRRHGGNSRRSRRWCARRVPDTTRRSAFTSRRSSSTRWPRSPSACAGGIATPGPSPSATTTRSLSPAGARRDAARRRLSAAPKPHLPGGGDHIGAERQTQRHDFGQRGPGVDRPQHPARVRIHPQVQLQPRPHLRQRPIRAPPAARRPVRPDPQAGILDWPQPRQARRRAAPPWRARRAGAGRVPRALRVSRRQCDGYRELDLLPRRCGGGGTRCGTRGPWGRDDGSPFSRPHARRLAGGIRGVAASGPAICRGALARYPAPDLEGTRDAAVRTLLLLALLQSGGDAPPTYSGRAGELRVLIPKLEGAVTIDGTLDEPEWGQAARLTGFSQYTPVDGRPAEDSTDVLVWYSSSAIFFGVRAFEPHGGVHATLADRDKITADDYVEILLDTFDDHRQAIVFGVNPLGIQSDGVLNEGTQSGVTGLGATIRDTVDLSADFVYQSKGRVSDYGYEVEIRIPFKSLRYQPAASQDWGLNVIRQVQHSGHQDTWTTARRASASFIGHSGTLARLHGLRRRPDPDLNRSINSKVSASTTTQARSGDRYIDINPMLGATVRWVIRQKLTLSGTGNAVFLRV